ncbi:MAG: CPBP family intramembrane glutamate endopeptidase, partial [Bacteroidota bacterium]|nr:CPBP family intramembrane glutamate endopeptidase [Bacteroidota bacterium]
ALIVGMAKVLKKEAVLPMVAFYVFIHFGKPALEAISSFFGGFILGIHSYYTKNIMGGIIIHMGIAWLMELAANIQHFYG